LISPQIALPAANAFLQWDAKAQDLTFKDGYKVMLAPNGGNTVADFTVTLYSITAENSAWTTRTANLSAYVGTTVRIAFVNNSNDQFVLLVDNISVNLAPTAPPNCPTLLSPANNATGLNYSSPVALSWSASAGATSYDVYLGTTANPTTLLGNTTALTLNATGLLASTTYYCKVIAKNGAGDSVGCTDFSFTTSANLFAPYCGPLVYSSGVEPITSVVFGGMTNTSPAAIGGTAHELFLNKVANVNREGTFPIKLQGNTDGSFTTKFIVFIDWNQDGDFLDAGETYFDTAATTIQVVGSTGVDGKEAIGNIVVPADALLGNTRMRIKKNFSSTTFYPNPCFSAGTLATGANTGFGQAEDYTVNVGAKLAVSSATKSLVTVYPNPVVDVLNIESPSKVQSVSVYDLSGKAVSNQILNATKSQVNLSKLAPGVYIVNIVIDNETKTVKVMKK
jgi:hypothetical protein